MRARRKFEAGGLQATLTEVDAPAEVARVARKRLIVADYELPAEHWSSPWMRRVIGWVETPYFRSFALGAAVPLLARNGFDQVALERCLPAFAIFEMSLATRETRPDAPL